MTKTRSSWGTCMSPKPGDMSLGQTQTQRRRHVTAEAGTGLMDKAPDADEAEGPSPGAPVGGLPRAASQAIPRPGAREVPSVAVMNGCGLIKPSQPEKELNAALRAGQPGEENLRPQGGEGGAGPSCPSKGHLPRRLRGHSLPCPSSPCGPLSPDQDLSSCHTMTLRFACRSVCPRPR